MSFEERFEAERLIEDTGGWISIHCDEQRLDEVTGRSMCVCVTKCDSFQCMLMRVWTLCDALSWACDSFQNKTCRIAFIYITDFYLFSALVRFPVHSFTSRGHSHGHSHSFCSILRKMNQNEHHIKLTQDICLSCFYSMTQPSHEYERIVGTVQKTPNPFCQQNHRDLFFNFSWDVVLIFQNVRLLPF